MSLSRGADAQASAPVLPSSYMRASDCPTAGKHPAAYAARTAPNNQERKVAINSSRPNEADRPPADRSETSAADERTPPTAVTREQLRAAVKVIEAEVNKVQARYKPAKP